MPKVNIYISDELKARMGEHDLNWSRIASSAIETAIKLEHMKGVDMEQADIERLRASRAEASEKRRAEGVAVGKRWALRNAGYETLEGVAALLGPVCEENTADGAIGLLAGEILGEGFRPGDCREIMESLFDRAAPSLDEIIGFIEGAAEVYDQI